MTTDQRLERFFGEIINAFKDGLLVVDRNGIILLVNDAMVRLSGFTREELIGSPCTMLDCDACELLRSDCEDAWCKLFKNRSVKNKRCMLTRKDGSYASALKSAPFSSKEKDGAHSLAQETPVPRPDGVPSAPVGRTQPGLCRSGHEVKTVMVAGKVLMRDRVVLTADEDAIRPEAQVQAEAVARRVAADPVHGEMALLEAMEAGRL